MTSCGLTDQISVRCLNHQNCGDDSLDFCVEIESVKVMKINAAS